ncbi:MAG: PepSY domain-containing protein [Pseudomonadota bacterium]|nr:PepSY domain-containing protein [Pseudomonadota bacterium]
MSPLALYSVSSVPSSATAASSAVIERPSLSLRFTTTPFEARKAQPPHAPIEPAVSFEQAMALATDETVRRGLSGLPDEVAYRPTYGLYSVHFTGGALGSPVVYIDGLDGNIVGARVPGQGSAGDVFAQLQFPLHSGRIAGLTGRIIIGLAGLATAMLAITGVIIWLKRRRSGVSIN